MLIPAFLALASLLLIPVVSGCSDEHSQASQLVSDGDALRASATDALRRSTVTFDSMVKSAGAGQPLPVNQTKDDTTKVANDLNAALVGLNDRDAKLKEAAVLNISGNYHEYIVWLRSSNDLMIATVNTALQIPKLIQEEQYSLAGWDEIKTKQVVDQIVSLEKQIDKVYNDAETQRNNAEQLRRDNPKDFGD